jgi:CheY-like chemotaxis protein
LLPLKLWVVNTSVFWVKPKCFQKRIAQTMITADPLLVGTKIVLVDDKSDFRWWAARFLAERGAQVFTAKDAFEALGLFRALHPDLVLTDINLPGRSGVELLADIRSFGPNNGGSIPVAAMTAYRLDPAILRAGFQSVIRKPFTAEQLLETIGQLREGASQLAA